MNTPETGSENYVMIQCKSSAKTSHALLHYDFSISSYQCAKYCGYMVQLIGESQF